MKSNAVAAAVVAFRIWGFRLITQKTKTKRICNEVRPGSPGNGNFRKEQNKKYQGSINSF